jgi:hypothetical protein
MNELTKEGSSSKNINWLLNNKFFCNIRLSNSLLKTHSSLPTDSLNDYLDAYPKVFSK